jgi:hypothetical protein
MRAREIWNRTKKTKPSDIRQKVNVYIHFCYIPVQMNIFEQHSRGE